ncbi:MAG: terminase [Mesorhizobium sp.]|nr:MAG: terminase [Mesorhizobium sp.]
MTKIPTPTEADAIFRTDFPSFIQKAFETLNAGPFQDNWHLHAITHHLQEVMEGKNNRLIITVPPRSLKSMITSIALPAFLLGQDPTKRMICVSYAQGLSETHAHDFRKVVNAPWYRRVFPAVHGARDTAEEFATKQGGFRLSTSISGTITGRGGSLIIFDDPLNASDAMSASEREKVKDFYRNATLSRLDDKTSGAIIIVMQRLHDQDLVGTVLQTGGYKHLKLPAIASKDEQIPIGGGRFHNRKIGDVLHPAREPLSVLDGLEKAMGDRQFRAQYQQEPLPDDGEMLKANWIKSYDQIDRIGNDQVIQSWDTAMKGSERNDFSVCTTCLVRGNDKYVLDVIRKQCEYPELLRLALGREADFKPNAILIEDHGSGTSLIQQLARQGLKTIGIRPEGDKHIRFSTASLHFEKGQVFLPRDAPWLSTFLDELLRFPQTTFDDQVDSVSQLLNWLENRSQTIFEWDMGFDDGPRLPFL